MNFSKTKGQGAVKNEHNRFEKNSYEQTIYDDVEQVLAKTQIISVLPKTIVNKVQSRGITFEYSMNPYQGCEHGCAYCYARPTHEYWGYSAGVDFERKILVKKNAPKLLEKHFKKRGYKPSPIMLSGNTDCYQPIEKKLKITRQLLQVCLDYRHPVAIITKNALILRDIDILTKMATKNLVSVAISLPTMNEELRQKLEPRTSSTQKKLKTIQELSRCKIPTHVMLAPIIPALNSSEILPILKTVAQKGAWSFGYTLIRLNDTVEPVFTHWLEKHYPDRLEKVISQIKSLHGGEVSQKDSIKRNKGTGSIAEIIHNTFKVGKQKYFNSELKFKLETHHFNGQKSEQLSLF